MKLIVGRTQNATQRKVHNQCQALCVSSGFGKRYQSGGLRPDASYSHSSRQTALPHDSRRIQPHSTTYQEKGSKSTLRFLSHYFQNQRSLFPRSSSEMSQSKRMEWLTDNQRRSVHLHSRVISPQNPVTEKKKVLIVLHGLFGNGTNFQTQANHWAKVLPHEIHLVDQRNHGQSTHTGTFSFHDLSNDLVEYFDEHKIQQADVLGHSMGGKTAMLFGLEHSARVNSLLVADIAPVAYSRTSSLSTVSRLVDILAQVDMTQITTRSQLDQILASQIPEKGVRDFLMTNAKPNETRTQMEWRINLKALQDSMDLLADFPVSENTKPFSKPTLFISGEKSQFIVPAHFAVMQRLFPGHHHTVMSGVGHWVHAENLPEFVRLSTNFFSK